MDVVLGSNPSFNWRSIVSFKMVLKERIRWKLEIRTILIIWNEPWFRKEENAFVKMSIIDGLKDLKVGSLIDVKKQCWNSVLLNDLFV